MMVDPNDISFCKNNKNIHLRDVIHVAFSYINVIYVMFT